LSDQDHHDHAPAARVEAAAQEWMSGAKVASFEQLTGGASGLAYRAELVSPDRDGVPLVVKAAPAGLAPVRNRDVRRQARVLRALHGRLGIAVAEVLFDDPGDSGPSDRPPGTGTRERLFEVTEEAWDRVHAVNLRAPFFYIQAVARHVVERGGGGRIISVSSASGFRAVFAHPVYSSSKAGIDALTRTMATALGEHGISVNAVAPGLTATRMGAGVGDDAAPQRAVESGPLANLLRRVSQPEDVAEVIAFLCLPESRQITGQTIQSSRQCRLTMTIYGVPRPHRILPAQLLAARSLALTRSRRSTGS
jgi:NAD(P)-dependent dehydrogenase (short-subunit alcohol dehydrogenase family)